MANHRRRGRAAGVPCPVCGLLDTGEVAAGEPSCIYPGGDACVRRGYQRLSALLAERDATIAANADALKRADALLLRAREVLTRTKDQLDVALEQLTEEVRLG